MNSRSRSNRFRRLTRVSLDEIGLPRTRARDLVLAHAWRTTAGEAVSRRASAVRLVRGTLDIAVVDRRWIEPLRRVLPVLAARLARGYPDLGIRRFRLRPEGESGKVPSVDVSQEEAAAAPAARSVRVEPTIAGATRVEPVEVRLGRARDRYLKRSR